jgi:hypothetical protein
MAPAGAAAATAAAEAGRDSRFTHATIALLYATGDQ